MLYYPLYTINSLLDQFTVEVWSKLSKWKNPPKRQNDQPSPVCEEKNEKPKCYVPQKPISVLGDLQNLGWLLYTVYIYMSVCVCVKSAENRGLLTSLQSGLRWTQKFAVCVKWSCPRKVETWPILDAQCKSVLYILLGMIPLLPFGYGIYTTFMASRRENDDSAVDWSPRRQTHVFSWCFKPSKISVIGSFQISLKYPWQFMSRWFKKRQLLNSQPSQASQPSRKKLRRLRLADA